MEKNSEVYKVCKGSIRKWVRDNYGQNEVDDPSWNIEELSAVITSNFIRKFMKDENYNLINTGMALKNYELTILFKEEFDDHAEADKIKDKIVEYGGTCGQVYYEGRKRLAYEINGREFSNYVYMKVKLPDGAQERLSSWLNINDTVLRYLLVRSV